MKKEYRPSPVGRGQIYNLRIGTIEIIEGSLTKYNADAIVVPANPDLAFTDIGLQHVVDEEGGPRIFYEAGVLANKQFRAHGPVDIGDQFVKVQLGSAHLTTGGGLRARHVIHSVAMGYDPQRKGYCNREIITKSTRAVLELGEQHGLQSIGFPALGTGALGVPLKDSIEAMIDEFGRHMSGSTTLKRLGIVLLDDAYDEGATYAKDKLDACFSQQKSEKI